MLKVEYTGQKAVRDEISGTEAKVGEVLLSEHCLGDFDGSIWSYLLVVEKTEKFLKCFNCGKKRAEEWPLDHTYERAEMKIEVKRYWRLKDE